MSFTSIQSVRAEANALETHYRGAVAAGLPAEEVAQLAEAADQALAEWEYLLSKD